MTKHSSQLGAAIVSFCSEHCSSADEMIEAMATAVATASTVVGKTIGSTCALVAQEMLVVASAEARRVAKLQADGHPIDDSDARWLS